MSEGFFSFMQPPPELVAAWQQERDRQHMANEAEQMAIEDLLGSLTPERLATLRVIIHDLGGDTEGRLSAYYEGVITTTLKLKFDKCPGCGMDKHDSLDSLLAEHGTGGADNVSSASDASSSSSDEIILSASGPMGEESLFVNPDAAHSTKSLPDTYVDVSRELIGQKGLMTAELISDMNEYFLDDLRDEDTGAILGFICVKCGMKYPSIEDRKLKRPDECSGCFQKSMWG